MHVSPVLLDCNFVVDSTNSNGLGLRNLKGPAVAAAFMATSATPAPGNPNPGAGTIVLQLADSYNRYFGGFTGFVSPLAASVTATTAGEAMVITSLGTATAAQFQAVGFPAAFTPALGAAFVATSSATIGGGATVAPAATAGAGIDHIEIVGDPNMTLSSQVSGGQLILQCFKNGVQTAPANGTVISLATYLSNSSILIQGE